MLKFCLKSVLLVLIFPFAHGQFFTETFSYPENQPLTSSGWNEHSGGSSNPVQTIKTSVFSGQAGNRAALLNGSGQDLNRQFPAINSGVVYASFLVNVRDASAGGDYFFHLGKSNLGTSFFARVFVRSNGDKIHFGVSKSSSAGSYSQASFELNKTYQLVLKYEFRSESASEDQVSLFISDKPAQAIAESTTGEQDTPELGTVALRQGANGKAPDLLMDEIRIANSWQEATDLRQIPFVSLSRPGHLYTYDKACHDSPVFEFTLSAYQETEKLHIWSPSGLPLAFSRDGKSWSNKLGFESAGGDFAYSFFLKTGAVPPDKANFDLVIGDSEGKELKRFSEILRIYSLRPDCSLPLMEVRTLPEKEQVKVSGRITASARQFPGFNYLQDSSGGIRIEGDFGFEEGDSVQFYGRVSSVFQEPVLVWDSTNAFRRFDKRPVIPQQTTLKNIREYEGQLVHLASPTLADKRFVFLPDANEAINEGNDRGIIRIWWPTQIAGHLKPQQEFSLTGIVARFRDQLQIYPRKTADMGGLGDLVQDSLLISDEYTFDLFTWNLEWFGSPALGPKNDELQLKNIAQVLTSANPDLAVLEEVTDLNAFDKLVSSMQGYSGRCSPAVSGGGDPGLAQRVCFLYKNSTVTPVSLRPLLSDAPLIADYPGGSDRFWASGRLPALFVCDAIIQGIQKRLHVVGIHAKANRNSQDREQIYEMRKKDIEVLKDSLDTQYNDQMLIVAGDFNDDVDESVVTGKKESTYHNFATDTLSYRILTGELSTAGHKSFIGYDNVIDHIMISDELMPFVLPNSTRLLLPFLEIDDYPASTSDHLPAVARFLFEPDFVIFTDPHGKVKLPSSIRESGRFLAKVTDQQGRVLIHTRVYTESLEKKLSQKMSNALPGQYVLRVFIGNSVKRYKIVRR